MNESQHEFIGCGGLAYLLGVHGMAIDRWGAPRVRVQARTHSFTHARRQTPTHLVSEVEVQCALGNVGVGERVLEEERAARGLRSVEEDSVELPAADREVAEGRGRTVRLVLRRALWPSRRTNSFIHSWHWRVTALDYTPVD